MKRKIRWELLFFDTLVFLLGSMMILVIYPSNITVLTPLQVFLYMLAGWLCVMTARMIFHVYVRIWRYAGQGDYIALISADGIATAVFLVIRAFIPNTITIVRALSLFTLNLLGCIVIRMIYQYVYQARAKKTRFEKALLFLLKLLTGTSFADEKVNANRIKIAIIGAGSVGAMLADELIQNPKATYEPVCFVDVDEGKVGREVYGIPVLYSGDDLPDILQDKGVQEVVFALPNIPQEHREELYRYYRNIGIQDQGVRRADLRREGEAP